VIFFFIIRRNSMSYHVMEFRVMSRTTHESRHTNNIHTNESCHKNDVHTNESRHVTSCHVTNHTWVTCHK